MVGSSRRHARGVLRGLRDCRVGSGSSLPGLRLDRPGNGRSCSGDPELCHCWRRRSICCGGSMVTHSTIGSREGLAEGGGRRRDRAAQARVSSSRRRSRDPRCSHPWFSRQHRPPRRVATRCRHDRDKGVQRPPRRSTNGERVVDRRSKPLSPARPGAPSS